VSGITFLGSTLYDESFDHRLKTDSLKSSLRFSYGSHWHQARSLASDRPGCHVLYYPNFLLVGTYKARSHLQDSKIG
jgi:hypothetical protein